MTAKVSVSKVSDEVVQCLAIDDLNRYSFLCERFAPLVHFQLNGLSEARSEGYEVTMVVSVQRNCPDELSDGLDSFSFVRQSALDLKGVFDPGVRFHQHEVNSSVGRVYAVCRVVDLGIQML